MAATFDVFDTLNNDYELVKQNAMEPSDFLFRCKLREKLQKWWMLHNRNIPCSALFHSAVECVSIMTDVDKDTGKRICHPWTVSVIGDTIAVGHSTYTFKSLVNMAIKDVNLSRSVATSDANDNGTGKKRTQEEEE